MAACFYPISRGIGSPRQRPVVLLCATGSRESPTPPIIAAIVPVWQAAAGDDTIRRRSSAMTQSTNPMASPSHPMQAHARHLCAVFAARVRLQWMACALYCGMAAGAALAQGSAEQGFRLMAAGGVGNCVVCHSMPGASGPASTFAPALQQVGTRYSAQELRQWVTDARRIKAATLMPPFGTTQGTNSPMLTQPLLSTEDIDHVVAALQTLR